MYIIIIIRKLKLKACWIGQIVIWPQMKQTLSKMQGEKCKSEFERSGISTKFVRHTSNHDTTKTTRENGAAVSFQRSWLRLF